MGRFSIGLLTLLLLLGSLGGVVGAAVPETLIPGGDAIGLELQLDGISVVELAEEGPAKAGLRCGDLIRCVDHKEVATVEDLSRAVKAAAGRPLTLTILRNGAERDIRLSPVMVETGWKLGIYVRDHLDGIGTVTYYAPEDGSFGALGHGVSGGEQSTLLPLRGGKVLDSEVAAVTRGKVGSPGALQGALCSKEICGEVLQNTSRGIFGTMIPADNAPIPVAESSRVHTGPAEIRSTVRGKEVCTYAVRIEQIYKGDEHHRNLLIKVTDPSLLEATGGIVQGMSGSPIIQDGKLIGAVTHVLIDDPTQGYGIFIENMLEAAA
ncbi:MAG: PDZ domain-containing protein [Oscillospiraceae bacterium]|nr:PDZ domain-containing protein [Oscillospiraceae bacterium]